MRFLIAVLAMFYIASGADACGGKLRQRRIRPVANVVKVTVAVATAPVKAFNCGCK